MLLAPRSEALLLPAQSLGTHSSSIFIYMFVQNIFFKLFPPFTEALDDEAVVLDTWINDFLSTTTTDSILYVSIYIYSSCYFSFI